MLLKLILFFTAATFTFNSVAQTFSNDREKFIKEFDKLMRSSTSNDLRPFVEEELTPILLGSNKFPEDYFSKMIQTSNLLIEKRLKPYPDVYNYIFSVYSLVEKNQPRESYEAWHESVDELMGNRNPRRITEFIEVSGAFFSRNVIALDRNFEWFCEGGKYEFVYDKTAFIKFENTNLICRTLNRGSNQREVPYSDSIIVKGTNGVIDLSRSRWDGEGGIITWEKVGLPQEETFAELTSYRTSMRSTNFSCDTVELTTPYFETKVKGKINDRAKKGALNENLELPYPQFLSFKASFDIPDFIEDVNYSGGFALEGEEFVGVGNSESPAQLTFMRNGKVFIKTASSQVRVSDKQLKAPNGKVTIYLGLQDSISHAGLDVSFVRDANELQLTRGSSGRSQSPFVNSYHKMDMYVEQIIWNRSESKLKLGFNFATSQQQRIARFESFDYYDERLYQRLQGMEQTHPLTALYDYAYKYDKFTMDEGTAATALKRTITQAKSTLLDLSTLGFIAYDTENGIVTVTQKTIHFVKAKARKSDFDNIAFASDLTPQRMDGVSAEEIKGNKQLQQRKELMEERNSIRSKLNKFGELDLGSLELFVQAVDFVPISEFKNTRIYPDKNEITVKQNRSMEFTGWVNSGKWEVKILSGNYSYEKNGFNIFESDVAIFRSRPLKEEHGKRPIPLQSAINGVKGELLVDHEKNRSGLDDQYGDFPKLISKEKTRVYYDQKNLHLGAYDKERFYFELDPFQVDSLATMTEKYIRFPGELTSAGIFPKFREELKLMPDYSLGFSQKVPEGGYEFYGTDASYENKILLSNSGLQGGGVINFINSSSTSKNLFTFLPDSTIGVAKFINRPQEAGVEFPDVDGPDAFITFLPRQKILKAASYNEPLAFFNGEANLEGATTVRESGMKGKGVMDFKDAKLGSQNFNFTRWEVDSDTAFFQLTNTYKKEGDLEEDPLAFKTDNVNAHVSFKDRKGVFKSNAGESVVEFPVNQYVCKIDQFTWMMDSDELELEKSEEEDLAIEGNMDLVGPNFFSIHPKQDSLQFRSPKARFSLKERTIYCYETKFIEVADARIYPDSSKVIIRKKAKMDPFTNAEIVANFITKYHKMINVDAEIHARRSYNASGDYTYTDFKDNKYLIHFDNIQLDTSYQTVAAGKVANDQGFKLSPQFDFYGDVRMKASDPLLNFNGATRIAHDCEKFEKNWMSFETSIDPENIQIPVKENMKDLEGNSISAGILWRHSNNMDSINMYPTFLSQVVDDEDPVVITASGFLQYSESAKEFQIGSKEKLINRGATGNYISLHTSSCSMNGDGRISLGMDYGNMETKAVGVINYNQEKEETTLNITLAIKAPFDQKIFEKVGEKIAEIEGLNDADFSSTTLEQAIMEWVDLKTADKIKSDYTLKKEFKRVPKEMQESIVITGLRLTSYAKFGDQQRGLKSSVDQVAIVSIYGQPVMKYVPFKFFAEQRTATADRLGMLMDVPGSYLYFFDYDNRKNGTMSILSNDQEFNKEIEDLKPDKRKTKKFIYQTTKNSAYKSQFLRVFQ
ncbi:MAG: hypothetical protein COA32_17360 [Fluviicola sp.]|nr:MAG: hypothetical protein COA32_17360 [Fluviicola sp.]